MGSAAATAAAKQQQQSKTNKQTKQQQQQTGDEESTREAGRGGIPASLSHVKLSIIYQVGEKRKQKDKKKIWLK